MSATPQEIAPAPAHGVPRAFPQPRPQPRLRPVPQAPAATAGHALREPTFDELVTGAGRHRGTQDRDVPASMLRRLALRSRLLQTPARRPAARGAEAP